MKLDDREKAKRALARAVRLAEWADSVAWRAHGAMLDAKRAVDPLDATGHAERVVTFVRGEITALAGASRDAARAVSHLHWSAVELARWLGAKESKS